MAKYSDTLTDHVLAPRNGGSIENADLIGHAGVPGRGAFMILYLRLEDERVAAAKYHTVGCGPTIASGSMLTEMIVGRTVEECREITSEKLIAALDGVPADKLHCPALAIAALRDALSHHSAGETSADDAVGLRSPQAVRPSSPQAERRS